MQALSYAVKMRVLLCYCMSCNFINWVKPKLKNTNQITYPINHKKISGKMSLPPIGPQEKWLTDGCALPHGGAKWQTQPPTIYSKWRWLTVTPAFRGERVSARQREIWKTVWESVDSRVSDIWHRRKTKRNKKRRSLGSKTQQKKHRTGRNRILNTVRFKPAKSCYVNIIMPCQLNI